MSWIHKILNRASAWIDEVAAAILAAGEALRPPRFARLVEQEDGGFLLQAASAPDASSKLTIRQRAAREKAQAELPRGAIHIVNGVIAPKDAATLAPFVSHARVEFVLRPDRFLIRPLQLPRRATDFLEGIIRAQIDRLTPWSPAEAAFGWRPSKEASGERMLVTVAATARARLAPYVNAVRGLRVQAVTISTQAPEGAAPIKVLEQKLEGVLEARRLRRGLIVLIGALAFVCVASVIFSAIAGSALEAQRDEINQSIAQRRAALHRNGDANSAAALALRQRKRDTPSAVIVYEELSRILPDDAYLTEMHIQGNKVQIVGLAHDAPELIHLIEQSPHFTHATFFAATTRSQSETAQHFSIEAHIAPVFRAPGAASQ
ncbi:PilN domain-containing protein [Methylocella tundrae]|uniref:Fimbrial assembly family protein n=1 Tax=Methylocella tundrae TaxID=227605 RepID=A0A4U8YXX5_METTU|nr:PilN domain-containing protein [Methylocella tundrae]WPP05719.1 PilN domain-containing protein [Methylocella tundrae]VFU08205.1 Fimbrial assembly family protein [Methylocella tundrae]